LIIENFCSTEGKPILIRVDDQEIRSDWIDERTSQPKVLTEESKDSAS